MLIKVVCLVVIENHAIWTVIFSMAVLTLKTNHVTIFSDMLFQTLKAELVEVATEALKTIARAVSALDMALEFKNCEGLDLLSFAAPVSNPNFIDNVLKKVGLNISKSILVVGLAVHANGHVAPLDLLVLDETRVAHNFRTL